MGDDLVEMVDAGLIPATVSVRRRSADFATIGAVYQCPAYKSRYHLPARCEMPISGLTAHRLEPMFSNRAGSY
jgi:hypothetical protein